MADGDLCTELVRSAEAVEAALAQLSQAMLAQGDAVRAALDAAHNPDDIASALGLTVGQVWNAGKDDPISPLPSRRARSAPPETAPSGSLTSTPS